MITIEGGSWVTITCTTEQEIEAISRACRVVKRGPQMTAKVNRAEKRRLLEIAARFSPKGPATLPDNVVPMRQEASVNHAGQVRILVGYSTAGEQFHQLAPATIVRNGRTYRFTGYGRAFRVNSDDNSARGIEPHFEAARYAYYQ